MKATIPVVFIALLLCAGAGESQAQTPSRELWTQAVASASAGDYEAANGVVQEMLQAGRNLGVRRFPLVAESAAALAREAAAGGDMTRAEWALEAARQLDPASATVPLAAADVARSGGDWAAVGQSLGVALLRIVNGYETGVIARADLLVTIVASLSFVALLFALILFLRYARAAAHDFREALAGRFGPGVTTVLAVALLFLPFFLWLGPLWLALYWLVLFFVYATAVERVFAVIALLILAAAPPALDWSAYRAAAVDSAVVRAAVAGQERALNVETGRRLRELVEIVPENARLQLLLGNLETLQGNEAQAMVHYRRAIAIDSELAGAYLNIGNLHFFQNDFASAVPRYLRAAELDPEMAIAHYNLSVASGEQYRFEDQGQQLERARDIDRGLIERVLENPPPQKIVMYQLPVRDAWNLRKEVVANPEVADLFGSYATFDPIVSLLNPLTLGSLLALIAALLFWAMRRGRGVAGSCIKCGRTFCHRCKSARESATYCTQCIHIYLKRDGVAIDTKRSKLDEVQRFQTRSLRTRKLMAALLPGSAQVLDGSTTRGVITLILFSFAVTLAVLVGRLAPVASPAEMMQWVVRVAAIVIAVIIWLMTAIPVLRQRVTA